MSTQIAVRIPENQLGRVDELVSAGGFESRAAVIRTALTRLLREIREDEIAEQYRRAYGQHPEDPSWGEVGEKLMAEAIREEESATPPA